MLNQSVKHDWNSDLYTPVFRQVVLGPQQNRFWAALFPGKGSPQMCKICDLKVVAIVGNVHSTEILSSFTR